MEAENNEVTVRERIVCVPSFLEDIRENVHLILGSKQMILHHEELMVFAQMLIVKYGREVCLTCPAFHVICGSTTPQNYHWLIEDFRGTDSIKTFLGDMKNRCDGK